MACQPRVPRACCLAAHLSFMTITVESSPIIHGLPACSSNLNRISGIDKSLGPRKQSHWSSHIHTPRGLHRFNFMLYLWPPWVLLQKSYSFLSSQIHNPPNYSPKQHK